MTSKTCSKYMPGSASGRGLLALVLVAAALWPRAASAEAFRYVDREGRVHWMTVASPPTDAALASVRAGAPAPPSTPLSTAGQAPAAVVPAAAMAAAQREPPWPVPYLEIVREAAALYSLPPELIVAVMRIESGFAPNAISRAGAMGLMQLMPATAQDMLVENAFDARQNIFGGARFLRTLVNRFDGSVALALAGYNAGPSAVERWGGIPPYAETSAYVVNVLTLYHLIQREGMNAARSGT